MTHPAHLRSLARSIACGLSLLALPAVCDAQSFSFAIGSGGGYRHHHGGWYAGYGFGPYWGPGWGPGWYGPGPVIYAPPPVIQQPIIYANPPVVVSPPATNQPLAAAPPAAHPPAALTQVPTNSLLTSASATDDRITIRNTSNQQLPVAFLLDSQDIELTDGQTRTFVGRTHRTIQYDRGGQFGTTQQELRAGHYEFRITASGWDLVRKPDLLPSAAGRAAIRTNTLPAER